MAWPTWIALARFPLAQVVQPCPDLGCYDQGTGHGGCLPERNITQA